MRRDPALQDLSRDHFTALVACKAVERILDKDRFAEPLDDVRRRFLDVVHGELPWHCEEENRLLLPLLDAHGGPDAARLAQMLREQHADLAPRFAALDDASGLVALGHAAGLLRAHARWEEDELFPWLQDHVDLDGLFERSQAFRRQHRGPGAVGRPRHPAGPDPDDADQVP